MACMTRWAGGGQTLPIWPVGRQAIEATGEESFSPVIENFCKGILEKREEKPRKQGYSKIAH